MDISKNYILVYIMIGTHFGVVVLYLRVVTRSELCIGFWVFLGQNRVSIPVSNDYRGEFVNSS